MGLLEIVQVVFIILKTTKAVNWSWKVVLIPLWINIGLTIVSLFFMLIAGLLGLLTA